MNLGIEHLSESITPNTRGIIWLTDKNLELDTPGVYEFNYLLNGILIKNLSSVENAEQYNASFFLGDNFGSPLFIGHIVIKNKKDLEKMDEHIDIGKSLLTDNSHIYIFNRSKNTANINILKILTEKYNDISFKNLNI